MREHLPGVAPTGIIGQVLAAWDRFWFQPGNPTTLAVIRIFCGLLTLYVHLAYCYDLSEFFGRDAWMNLDRADKIRHEAPWFPPPSGWTNPLPNLSLPPEPEVRDGLFRFLKDLPLKREYLRQVTEAIKDPKAAPLEISIPPFIALMPPGQLQLADSQVPSSMLGPTRAQLIRFIHDLPDDQAERDRIVSYMQYWQYDPRQLSYQGNFYWSVWFHVTDPFWMQVTHAAILLIMFLFTIGFCTRITSVLTWLAAVSYIHRSSVTLFGGDTMMNILLLYLMIAPCGAALSVDRLLARWWAVRRARLAGLPLPPAEPPAPSVSANFAQRLLQIHFCFIYMAAGTSKLLGGNWWNGTAIYYTMANYEFSPLRYQYYLDTLRFLCQHRWLWEIIVSVGSFGTVALEISFPFLVWNRRLWPVMVLASMLLHIFIAVFMGLTAFSLLMATLVMAFIPGAIMAELLQRARPYVPAFLRWQRSAPAPDAPPPAAEADPSQS